ncbi:MAG TPA: hypothetical protein VE954_29135 [Oligoflexus sp.]|uniref:hypothetical protein n=1 Tax=Oligoflexus sp. TaxID=1971216 RepID=UPI002D6CF89A|nr:hypothetical protein [Oligoflexus sp.]HYX37187.1 hypothetical protein [Oligoflexus sp.]
MDKLRTCFVGFVCILLPIFHQTALALVTANADPTSLLSVGNCSASDVQHCEELKQEIQTLWSRLLPKLSPRERALIRLQINRAMETLDGLKRGDDPQQRDAIDRKYRALAEILQNTPRDLWAEAPDVAYHHLEMKAVQEVTDRFGRLEISPDQISRKDTPRWQKREVTPPWAGYWYPRYDPILYTGDMSVFAKVDRMMTRIGRESQAQALENSMSSSHPESWEGLCNAWSNAAMMEPEPKNSIDVLGESLSISDQKAIFTKLYEAFPVTVFGVRYDGDYISDGTYQDIRPEALHRIMLSVLGDLQRPFIIDDTAGVEVWQQPVFKVEWVIHQDESIQDAYQVSMRLWKIKMRSQVSEDLTNRNDYAFEQYQYRLFVDPAIKAQEGRLLVIAGEWLGTSRKNHPDYVVLPQDNGWPASHNTWLQSNLDPILALLRHPASFLHNPE